MIGDVELVDVVLIGSLVILFLLFAWRVRRDTRVRKSKCVMAQETEELVEGLKRAIKGE